ncbi:MAG: transporter substrate-binding domain-containing protein [Eggerthellaceae bacterium]|nr:transporter substrate-binding domain-containing protein [Eggerthellaceae bacterium]
MSKMKKILALVCAGVLVASVAVLAACSSSASVDKNKTYVIATDTAFAPFEYQLADGSSVGIDMDIIKAIAEKQGIKIEIKALGFDAALQAVQSGQADGVIAGMSITDERKKVFDFSDAYYDSTVCCAVAPDSGIASMADLSGKTVAVKNGTQSAKWADSLKDKYGYTVTTFETSDIMYQDVLAGNSAACFEDTPVMAYAITNPDSAISGKLTIIEQVDAKSEFATPYGFAVAKGKNAGLLQAFNAGLKDLKSSGEYDKIIAKYITVG